MWKEWFRIILLIALFIFIRSINFTQHLNFSYDQAWFSTRVLEIWRNKEFTLVGPGSSIVVNGKQVLYGSINYYFQLLFQILGKFDPVISSYAFMLFAALMIIPLYYGIKMLADEKVALLSTALYALAPTYIDFTRFFFAPNFQLSLTPLMLLFMGFYQEKQKDYFLFLTFFILGILMQFHFAILLLFLLLMLYYFGRVSNRTTGKILFAISGFILGLSPLILFEIKNNFYNFRVFADYLKNSRSVANFELLPHRYLVLSFTLVVWLLIKINKFITKGIIIAVCAFLLSFDLFIYLPVPKTAFGMSKNWNYPLEKKVYKIIKQDNLKNINIVNLIYDNLAVVIKYQMKKDNYDINYADYYNNRYLYIISPSESVIANSNAYEVKTFTPRKKIKQWILNDYYNLYLFERSNK